MTLEKMVNLICNMRFLNRKIVVNAKAAMIIRIANKAHGAYVLLPSGMPMNKLLNSEIWLSAAMMEPTGLHMHTIIKIATANK